MAKQLKFEVDPDLMYCRQSKYPVRVKGVPVLLFLILMLVFIITLFLHGLIGAGVLTGGIWLIASILENNNVTPTTLLRYLRVRKQQIAHVFPIRERERRFHRDLLPLALKEKTK